MCVVGESPDTLQLLPHRPSRPALEGSIQLTREEQVIHLLSSTRQQAQAVAHPRPQCCLTCSIWLRTVCAMPSHHQYTILHGGRKLNNPVHLTED